MTTTNDTTVSVSTEVDAPLARAFHVFTAEIGTWWDEDKHLLEAPLAEMVFEPFVGGNIIDRGTDGSECRWARVLTYEPPSRVCFSWDINTQWQIETDPTRTSEVEITFTEITPERTLVVLVHRHLDRHGEGWETMRDAVGSGWRLTPLAERIERANHISGRLLPIISDDAMRARLAGTSTYTTILLRTTDSFVRPTVDPIVWEHGRRNMALAEAGILSIVLPVTDDTDLAGIGVFAAAAADVQTIMDDDPGVRAGIFTYDLHPVRGFPGAALP
ncbi:MAG: activator of Hsp90 ATPase 1 family protein [Aeromicrobium sp.]|nr:activator of Hsp90 ATPase 1 family protein [Aeromicrobium sp.]